MAHENQAVATHQKYRHFKTTYSQRVAHENQVVATHHEPSLRDAPNPLGAKCEVLISVVGWIIVLPPEGFEGLGFRASGLGFRVWGLGEGLMRNRVFGV